MSYLDTFTSKTPAELIADEAPAFEWALKQANPTFASRFITYTQASRGRAAVDSAMAELRQVWRLANTDDPGWRDAVRAFTSKYGHLCAQTRIRFGLIADRAGHAQEQKVTS